MFDREVMLIYDIACQYTIQLQDRIRHLLPDGLNIDSDIGQFHVHGHKDICLFRYLTSFIPRAGVVAGEILESLWAVLNTVTPAMRTATLAHRGEDMDNHMRYSNHKKCLGMGGCQLPRAWVIIHKNLQLRAWQIDFYMHRACPPGQMTIIQT